MVGSIVLATDQGLGVLAREFYKHGIIDVVAVHPHTTRTNHYEWYPNRVPVEELLQCDTLLFFETAFDWTLVKRAKEKGIKIILMPMYECSPNPLPVEPDLIIAPSLLDYDIYPASVFLPVPVAVHYRQRKRARVFVHNSGNGGLGGRNGTAELLAAIKYVESPATFVIRSQEKVWTSPDKRVHFEGAVNYTDLWYRGDVFIFPEKFNGLSLPLQEAYASGMLVMAGDRYPVNTWLPTEPLIPVSRYTTEKIAREFDCAQFDPKTIAATIDRWYGKDISQFSLRGKQWAEEHSWEVLGPKYKALCDTSARSQASEGLN